MSALPEIDFRVPDLIGEVTGYRAWMVTGTDRLPRLGSVSAFGIPGYDFIWPTNRWFLAKCPKGHTTDIPIEDCSCGIYAAKTLEQLVRLRYGVYDEVTNKVIGEVAFAGKVIEGSQGWRAEKARVVRLWVPYEKWRWAAPLGVAYRVPVELGNLFDGDTIRTHTEGRQ